MTLINVPKSELQCFESSCFYKSYLRENTIYSVHKTFMLVGAICVCFYTRRTFMHWNAFCEQHCMWLVLSGAQSERGGGGVIYSRKWEPDLPSRFKYIMFGQGPIFTFFLWQGTSLKWKLFNETITKREKSKLPSPETPFSWTEQEYYQIPTRNT